MRLITYNAMITVLMDDDGEVDEVNVEHLVPSAAYRYDPAGQSFDRMDLEDEAEAIAAADAAEWPTWDWN